MLRMLVEEEFVESVALSSASCENFSQYATWYKFRISFEPNVYRESYQSK
jgi:hypothetical protein